MFLLPRFYVYHQEAAVGSPEDRAWFEREARVRSIILNPAMLVVWALGLMLAADNRMQVLGAAWFQVKVGFVVALSAYQGWLGVYGKKLASGQRPLSSRAVRMINEIPGVAAAIIVVLVIVRPF